MPSPLDILLNPLSLIILAMYALLVIWEAVYPARKLPPVPNWKMKGIISYFIFFMLSVYLPLWYTEFLPSTTLFDLSGLNPVVAALLGIGLYELGMYVWHRIMHRNDRLWRVMHQMHHSAERIDTFGAFYLSPVDMIGWIVLGSLCFSVIAGLPPESSTIVLLVTNFLSIFTHANIRTPRWLGFIIQRPESHAMHHEKGVHAYNYCDLPLFDMLFGTFRNPSGYVRETGFYHGASARMREMLLFRDIGKSKS